MRFPSLLDLNAEQQNVIDLPFHGCHVVTGGPGAGKTVMAIFRSWALATAGREVILVTRSNLLRQYLAQAAPELSEAVTVTTFHRWIRAFWSAQFQTDPPQTDEGGWNYDWLEMQKACILQQIASKVHLVIDEGQNLPVAFYQLCRTLGIGVTVFADEEQRIGDDQSTLSEICHALAVSSDVLVLHKNHRNSREIAVMASAFRNNNFGSERMPAPAGRLPCILRVPSLEHLVVGISQYFNAQPERSIGIICRSTFLLRDIQSRLTKHGLAKYTQAYAHDDKYRKEMDFTNRPIRIVTTASMKGLEFDSVFVPDLDSYTEDPSGVAVRLRFFVLCTRAREDLHFVYRGTHEPAIVAGIDESLLSRPAG
ncbi:AAA family ATPase [Streptomyces sp. NPDC102364]|uniref:AAA family ATPase n=1 Tax=Streptomyces sp. NPDC102364 TaxID=3366161 RepID=UPI00381CFFF5